MNPEKQKMIDELKRLEVVATPTPWDVKTVPVQHEWETSKSFLAAVPYDGHPYKGHTRFFDVLGDEEYPTKENDLALVAAMRNALPALLEEVEKGSKWIPVTEGLPNPGQNVVILVEDASVAYMAG